VLWLAEAGALNGVRTALPWSLYADADSRADQAIFTPHLYEIDGNRLTCCGGAASVDFALTLIDIIFGSNVQAPVKELLCVDRVRGREERQRVALQARFGTLQPKLTEAVTLMEANIEEPLSTDEIAQLAGVSRRQLERLFKQYLGSLPSRYYLELRLQRARQLLLDTNNSIVQVGLMCGFSSGSHFSTAFGACSAIRRAKSASAGWMRKKVMNAKLDSGVTTRPVTRQTFDEVLVPTYAPAAMVPVRAAGLDVWDQEGKHYLDFTSGIAVSSLGHCNPVLVDA
jgi:transcriptional regulator GlxA family with amidase domain